MINIIRTKASMILNTFIDSPVCIGNNLAGLGPVKHPDLPCPDASRLEVLTKVKDEGGKCNGSSFLFPRSEGYNFVSHITHHITHAFYFPTINVFRGRNSTAKILIKTSHNFSGTILIRLDLRLVWNVSASCLHCPSIYIYII